MNDQELKKILSGSDIPPYDENAKKCALNLAMAEFNAVQYESVKKSENNAQGFSFLSRLIGHTPQDNRKKAMKKRTWVYGGLATTVVAIMAVGLVGPKVMRSANDSAGMGSILSMDMDSMLDFEVGETRSKSDETYKYKRESTGLNEIIVASKPAYSPPVLSDNVSSVMPAEPNAPKAQGMAEQSIGRSDMPTTSLPATPLKESKKRVYSGLLGKTAGISENAALMRQMPARMVLAEEDVIQPSYQDEGRDKFKNFAESPIKLVSKEPVSTFSIDVDTAAYSFVRKSLNAGRLPPKDAVRIEEMVNYFDYAWPVPTNRQTPFKPTVVVTASPWTPGNKLIHIGIKGYEMAVTETPRSNLVFLLDVSGSMNAPDKLPLVKNALRMLLDGLKPEDTVAIVVYAGAAGTVLEPTAVKDKAQILAALDRLSAGGSTAGAQGIKLAYDLAEANFDKQAVNRIMLATDGDFNVGITNTEELKGFVERKRKSGVFLSILGFGRGNWNDQLTQALAQNGNGVAAYIDTLSEARKVLVEEASSTLFPIAKDVKIQVEFNPEKVSEYRLVGYETRALRREDFNNDAVDAGDIGSGHTLTAIYEITPKGAPGRKIDDSRYQTVEAVKTDRDFSGEYAFLKMRYKLPNSDTSTLITQAITTAQADVSGGVANEANWATAVASFAQLLKGGKFTGKVDYDAVIALAQKSKGDDVFGYRAEFINLVRLAKSARGM